MAVSAFLVFGLLTWTALAQPALVPPLVRTQVSATAPAGVVLAQDARVILAVTVDRTGHVTQVEVMQSAGDALDQAASVAARQWLFEPAKKDGNPVTARIRVTFDFPATAPETPPQAPASASSSAPPSPAASASARLPTPSTSASAPVLAPSSSSFVSSEKAPDPSDSVTIRGTTEAPQRGAADLNVQVGKLAEVPRKNAAALLTLAPGFFLTNEGGEGHADQIFLRGFDAREGQDIELTVGGVPINESGNLHGNGYADTHFLIPELIESVRVLEGPYDPRQGNYAVAGSADFHLGLAERGESARFSAGSFGTERMLMLWGPEGESTHTFAGAEIYRTDGFGQNRAAKRGSAIAQYEGTFSSHTTYRLTAQAYSVDYQSAGVIREDDYASGKIGFYGTYDPRQGGTSTRYSLSADIENRDGATVLGQQVFLIFRDMTLRENFTGFLEDPQTPFQQPHPQRGDLIDLSVNSMTVGGRGYARHELTVGGLKQDFELGYFARLDHSADQQQRIDATSNAPYLTEANLDSYLADIGIYGDLGLHVLPWLTLRGGVRADLFTFDVNNLCATHTVRVPDPSNPPGDASCFTQGDYGVYQDPNQRNDTSSISVLPKATIILGPFQHVTGSLSYGQGVRSIDPIYITQGLQTPFASIQSFDGALEYNHDFDWVGVDLRSGFFTTHVSQDLIFDQTVGRNTLASGTTRTGWSGLARLRGDWFDESLNITLVRSVFDDTNLLVPYVPNAVVREDAAIFGPLPFELAHRTIQGTLGAGVTYVGKRPLPYGQVSDTIFTVDTTGKLRWSLFELGLSITNLLGAQYREDEFNYASSFTQTGNPSLVPVRHFIAGVPRMIMGTFGIIWGGT